MQTAVEQSLPAELLTVQQLSARFPAWSPAALRNMILNARDRESTRGPIQGNGLAPAIYRVGRKVLVDPSKFLNWIAAQQQERRRAA